MKTSFKYKQFRQTNTYNYGHQRIFKNSPLKAVLTAAFIYLGMQTSLWAQSFTEVKSPELPQIQTPIQTQTQTQLQSNTPHINTKTLLENTTPTNLSNINNQALIENHKNIDILKENIAFKIAEPEKIEITPQTQVNTTATANSPAENLSNTSHPVTATTATIIAATKNSNDSTDQPTLQAQNTNSSPEFAATLIPATVESPEGEPSPNFFEFSKKNQKKLWVDNKINIDKKIDKKELAFFQRGASSWYGEYFHGRLTASGVPFNMFSMTAAHRTLPLGTKIKVTNPSNEKSIVVEVNDRGPYARDRILDLSFGAAKALGFIKSGVAQVELYLLEPLKNLNKKNNSKDNIKNKEETENQKKQPSKISSGIF